MQLLLSWSTGYKSGFEAMFSVTTMPVLTVSDFLTLSFSGDLKSMAAGAASSAWFCWCGAPAAPTIPLPPQPRPHPPTWNWLQASLLPRPYTQPTRVPSWLLPAVSVETHSRCNLVLTTINLATAAAAAAADQAYYRYKSIPPNVNAGLFSLSKMVCAVSVHTRTLQPSPCSYATALMHRAQCWRDANLLMPALLQLTSIQGMPNSVSNAINLIFSGSNSPSAACPSLAPPLSVVETDLYLTGTTFVSQRMPSVIMPMHGAAVHHPAIMLTGVRMPCLPTCAQGLRAALCGSAGSLGFMGTSVMAAFGLHIPVTFSTWVM